MSAITFNPFTGDYVLNESIKNFMNEVSERNGKFDDCPMEYKNVERVRDCRKVVVTGPVGVGKTTILSEICKLLDGKVHYLVVPEYIDELPDATEKLEKYLRGELSSYEFQRYVTVYYIQYLKKIADKITPGTVLIFERVPDDALWCFIRMDLMKGKISSKEHQRLSHLIATMNEYFNLPSYSKTQRQSALIIKSDELSINAKVASDFIINSSYPKIVIGLFNDVKVCHERVLQRARPGEDSYNFNGIFMFNQCYANMYKNLMFA